MSHRTRVYENTPISGKIHSLWSSKGQVKERRFERSRRLPTFEDEEKMTAFVGLNFLFVVN